MKNILRFPGVPFDNDLTHAILKHLAGRSCRFLITGTEIQKNLSRFPASHVRRELKELKQRGWLSVERGPDGGYQITDKGNRVYLTHLLPPPPPAAPALPIAA